MPRPSRRRSRAGVFEPSIADHEHVRPADKFTTEAPRRSAAAGPVRVRRESTSEREMGQHLGRGGAWRTRAFARAWSHENRNRFCTSIRYTSTGKKTVSQFRRSPRGGTILGSVQSSYSQSGRRRLGAAFCAAQEKKWKCVCSLRLRRARAPQASLWL